MSSLWDGIFCSSTFCTICLNIVLVENQCGLLCVLRLGEPVGGAVACAALQVQLQLIEAHQEQLK